MASFRKYIAVITACAMLLVLCSCSFLPAAPEEPSPTAELPEEVPTAVIQPEPEQEPMPPVEQIKEDTPYVCLNELMASNKATLADADGDFPDWVELYNYGREAAELTGCTLASGGSEWVIPELILPADSYALIFCSGKDDPSTELHSSFTLPREGTTVALSMPGGTQIDAFSYTDAPEDRSLTRNEDGNVISCAFPTPGAENTARGFAEVQGMRAAPGPLVIDEVMVYNEWFLGQKSGYYDWVQLKNVSDAAVELGDFYLSDSGSDRAEYQLPAGSLAPGAIFTVFCTGDSSLTLSGGNAPFSLSAENDQLYLSYKDGTLLDYAALHDVPYGGSCGRMDGENGFFYFVSPTPDAPNVSGKRAIADKPVLIGRDGVFDGVESVSVTLAGGGTIRYTTDGSVPTEFSAAYTGPIVLTSTSVLRAACFVDGLLPSDTLTLSYILNEDHQLPVVSLVADPGDMFGGAGVYSCPTLELERLGSVALYDGENSFAKDCGYKLHGETSKVAQDKKSFKLTFRSRYDGELEYDLFGNGITRFSSILIRAAQEDYYSTQMRDNLMHQLAIECCPELPSQDMKYCVLYINGSYWGLYCLREAHSAAHYANHYGYNEDSVVQWKGQWPSDSSVNALYEFIRTCTLADADNYAYISSHIDIDSLIAWSIIEAYSGNFDCNASNIRFYYSTEDDMVRYALVDLDLGMFSFDVFDIPFKSGYDFSNIPYWLLNNPDFRAQLLDTMQEYLHGPLATEHVLALIDELASQIRPEIPRDRERWGGSLENWEKMVNGLKNYVTRAGGRDYQVADAVKGYIGISSSAWDDRFGDLRG